MTDTFTLPCSAEDFWKLFFDAEYQKAFYLDELKFKDFVVIENNGTSRKIRVSPRVNLPGPLASLVGDSFAYEEHGTLDRARGLWTWKMVKPAGSSGKDMVSTSGTIKVVDDGANQSKRTDDMQIEGKIFGIGGMIESTIEKEVRASAAKEMAFLKRWVAQRK